MTRSTPRKVSFLERKDIRFTFQRYGIEALGAMALGLFASLLIGTILNTLGTLIGANVIGERLVQIGAFASSATGAAMALSIGYALKSPPLVLFTLAGVGMAANSLGGAGGPLAVFFVTVIAAEFGKAVSKETPVDILVTPATTMIVGGVAAIFLAPGIGRVATSVGDAIMWATNQQPLVMGILVSVIVGMALTLPISSAAICAALGLTGLAGGAAFAGCCAQMVGFAVMTYRENRVGGLVAQGLGTSMLQVPNILKNPKIWIPPTLVAAITGPIATVLFRIEMNGPPVAAGMGTSGLVGPIGVITGWFMPSEQALAKGAAAIQPGIMDWLGVALVAIILPAVLTPVIGSFFRRNGWMKPEQLKLDLG